jgi:hypothetical protein
MEDTRCCGSGTCIINAKGFCWCGQRWDGTRMCFPEKTVTERRDEDAKLKLGTDDGQDQA